MKETLARYPRRLDAGLTLRPMEAADEAVLAEFFRRIPVDERQLFKEDVTKADVIRGWIRNLDYTNIFPLLVFHEGRAVADATLHRDRRGWSRHVAEIRIAVHPEYRGRGLGRALVREFVEISPAIGIAILNAAMLDGQADARALFESAGFVSIATLPQHAIDLAGRVHDVLMFSLTVVPPERLAPEASLKEEEADVGGGA